MKYVENILDLVGNTPLVKINKLNPNPKVTILAKLEYLNPGGSVKDRAAKSMLEGAEKKGKLKKGDYIVEATSGNTGIAIAMAAAVKGYKTIFTQPDLMSEKKATLLRALGAEVIRCETMVPIDDPRSYKSTAKRIGLAKKAFRPDQYSNPDNPLAHYETTGPEIWEDTDGKLDYIVIGLGTGGTGTGTVQFLKEKNLKIKFISPDPIGSMYSGGKPGPFFVEGIGHIFFPENVHPEMVDEFVRFESKEAILMAQRLAKEEGILAGPTSGAALYAAIEIAKKLKNPATIVALFPDSGERYTDYLYEEDFEVPSASQHETKKSFVTEVLHSTTNEFNPRGELVSPIHRSSTYTFNNVDEVAKIFKGDNKEKSNRSKYLYARGNHPNQRELEVLLAKLEKGVDALAFSSGMAAITALAQTVLSQGDEVLVSNIVYGETFRLYGELTPRWGVKTTFVDVTDLKAIEKAITKKTKLLHIETPTNPLLTIADIEQISLLAKKHTILFVVDNTFATPYLQQPLQLGADVVVASTSKYLSGHADALGGIVVAKNQELILDIWWTLFVTGAVIDAQAAWLIQRGLKTLPLRMEKHCDNALAVAKYLSKHSKVKKVHYPGLLTHPQHELARRQMNGFGGVLSFELDGDIEQGKRFVNSLKLFSISVSLGALESLVNHPASMTHSMIPKKNRLQSGVSDGLIRFSIGIEDISDIIADIDQAFAKI